MNIFLLIFPLVVLGIAQILHRVFQLAQAERVICGKLFWLTSPLDGNGLFTLLR